MSDTIGDLVDKLKAKKDEIDANNAALAVLKKAYDEIEEKLFAASDAQKTTGGRGEKASFTIGESVVPQVKDWDLFLKFIYKKKYGHLLERRPSVVACRELFDTVGTIPGAEKFTKRKLNLRSI